MALVDVMGGGIRNWDVLKYIIVSKGQNMKIPHANNHRDKAISRGFAFQAMIPHDIPAGSKYSCVLAVKTGMPWVNQI